LQEFARTLGVSSHVRFLGSVDAAQLRNAYAACDAFVLAPREEPDSIEGFGLVLLEAAAAGRASVTTTAGGTAEAVRHEVTGLVVPAQDREALTGALRRVLMDRAFSAQLGAAGREHAAGAGSWERTADSIFSLLAASGSPVRRATHRTV
jgi:glycosyltransferase involved in cell wall biosynthesis